MAKIKAIIFDIDGVLIDVSKSYRVAIAQTAEFFLGQPGGKLADDFFKVFAQILMINKNLNIFFIYFILFI